MRRAALIVACLVSLVLVPATARSASALAVSGLGVGVVSTGAPPRTGLDAARRLPRAVLTSGPGQEARIAPSSVRRPGDLPLDRLGPPSQQYVDAMAHAGDRPVFAAYRPATIRLRPSAGPSRPIAATAASSIDGSDSLPGRLLPQAVVSSTGLRREVMGFLPYWYLADPDLTLTWSVLSTVAYFGLTAGPDGHVVHAGTDGTPDAGWQGWRSGDLTTVIDQAHQHGTRVTLSVERFGWTTSQTGATVALLGSPTACATLVSEIVGLVTSRGVDGVNLDFEPIPAGQSDRFVALVRQLRAALDAAGPGLTLTIDSTADLGNYDVANLTAPGAADSVLVMGYDFRTSGSGTAGSVDPLGGPRYDLQDAVTAYLAEAPASKVILGVPYYGRAWSTVSDALDAKTLPQNASNGYSVSVPYDNAMEVIAKQTPQWDPVEQTPWAAYRWQNCATCPQVWRQLYYDDAQSLGLRYDLVNRMNLGGVGMWTLGMDGTHAELYAALANKFLTDTTPPDAGIVTLPESVDSASFPVSWVGLDDWSGVASYDLQVSVDGGPWADWLTATTQTAATYSGQTGHGYAFRVRATDGKGNVGPWDVTTTWIRMPSLGPGGFAQVVQGPLNVRSGATVSSQVLGQLQVGDVIAITGGPVLADGYTWWRATGPVAQWGPVDLVHTGVWFAGSGNGTAFLAPRQAPNATTVNSEIGLPTFTPVDTLGGAPSALPPGIATGLSPNGDGHADALRIGYHLRLPLSSLELVVTSANSVAPLGSVQLPGLQVGDQSFDWDGRVGGQVVPDGTVFLQLVGRIGATTYTSPGSDLTDPATQDEARVVVRTIAPTIQGPILSSPAFSPNGDGSRDTATVTATGGPGTVAWIVTVLDAGGATVRSWSGAGTGVSATWDGLDANGAHAPDGTYTIRTSVLDGYGNAASADLPLMVDTVVPTGTFGVVVDPFVPGAVPYVFSPNGDRYADTATFVWSASKPVAGTIRVLAGSRVRWTATFAAATSGRVTWNGRATDGSGVPDGGYRVVLAVSDAAGNPFGAAATVIVDRLASSLAISPARFYPQDRDSLSATERVSFRLARAATTTLRVLDAGGHRVRTAWSGRRLASGAYTWTFDGKTSSGTWLPQADYTVQLIATDPVGKVVMARTVTVAAFMVRTSVTGSQGALSLVVDAWASERLKAPPAMTLSVVDRPTLAADVQDLGGGHYRATFADPGLGGSATLTLVATDASGGKNRMSLPVALSVSATGTAAGPGTGSAPGAGG